jgi:hypothetical protein
MTVEDMKAIRRSNELPECYDMEDLCPSFCAAYPCDSIIDFELKRYLNPESVFLREAQ